MMSERNIISGITATALTPFIEDWQSLIIWLIVASVLIIADLRFGITAARKRGEKIRSSRAIRRTINKFVDYLCWISIAWVLGGSFGHLFGIPLLPAIVMVIVCSIELSSIIDNYFESHGIKKKINVFKFITKLFNRPDFEDVIEDKPEQIE